jgi:SsrA-binding protein
MSQKTKAKKISTGVISNRRARFDYALKDFYSFGIVLSGWETKALRLAHGHLKGAYVTFKSGELYLVNATIMPTKGVGQNASVSDTTRSRKLLAKKSEIAELQHFKNQGLSLIPTEFLIKTKYIKLKVGAGKGNRQYDKRNIIKKRDISRDTKNQI